MLFNISASERDIRYIYDKDLSDLGKDKFLFCLAKNDEKLNALSANGVLCNNKFFDITEIFSSRKPLRDCFQQMKLYFSEQIQEKFLNS